MKIAIGFSTKNQLELTKQTWPRLLESLEKRAPGSYVDIFWCDASDDPPALNYFMEQSSRCAYAKTNICGGADAAIAWKLYHMLNSTHVGGRRYDYIGLLENDVFLDEDWFDPTMALFEKGEEDGLSVGAVSSRSYVDRVLIQRDGYAVMHNIGAGVIIFSREAAERVLRSFRTHWWPDNVRLFASISGIDLRTYACFRGSDQFVTTDWGWEAQLARHGLAALALTPAKCTMVGQNPPLEQQGLELTSGTPTVWASSDSAFERYRDNLAALRSGLHHIERPSIIHRDGASMLFFPHQLGYLAGGPQWQGALELKWSQGFGPFAYRAGEGGASLSLRISGSCAFLMTGGDAGATVEIEDTRSGFRASPSLPADQGSVVSISVPGSPVPRTLTCRMDAGAVFYGLHCDEPQVLDTQFRFGWQQLPEAM